MKIVYCVNSIRSLGGIQRVTIVKANALAEVEGNEVYIAVSDHKHGTDVDQLSPKVHVVDLDINYHNHDSGRSKLANIIVGLSKKIPHYKALKRFLTDLKPDIVISVGTSEKYLLPAMKGRTWKIIREFHSEKDYRLKHARSRFDRLKSRLVNFYDFNFVEKKYDKIVVLTHEDKDMNWKGWENVSVIPNPTSFKCDEPSPLSEKVVVAMGRLHPVKNFSSLIRAFQLVAQRHPDWTLKIYGQGEMEATLQRQIDESGLQQQVLLMGFTSNVQEALRCASICALTSLSEGFALVITEAMECGVPVVSYQCPYGPKDIITDGKDGFLVPLNDESTLANRICTLIDDDSLRHDMGQAARLTAKSYQIERIVDQWMALFSQVLKGYDKL